MQTSLKLVYAIFFKSLFFAPNGSPSKIIKNVFYHIEKPLSVLEIFKSLYFFASFPQFPDLKGQMEVEKLMMS